MLFELVRTLRAGGGGRTERSFLDFAIDGQDVSRQIKADLVTPLGWGVSAEQVKAIDRLLRRSQPDLPSGRTSLYVCPECGDLGCGAVGAFVERDKGAIVWRDLAFEGPGAEPSPMSEVGPFVLDGGTYVAVLEQLRSDLMRRGA